MKWRQTPFDGQVIKPYNIKVQKLTKISKNMKSLMQKITVGSLSAMLFAGIFIPASSAFAAASFNNDPLDKPTLRVSKISPTSWGTSVSVNNGDIVSFDVYFHNTAINETAQQTTITAVLPTGSATNHNVTATISATNASSVSGSVTVNLSSSQTLTYRTGSTKFYDHNGTMSPMSDGIASGGISIGNLPAGWLSQGHVTFQAQVGGQSGTTSGTPAVLTSAATNVAENTATLNASVNPNGTNTTVYFQYGTDNNLTTPTIFGNQTIGNGTTNVNVIAYLGNLTANTTYYYRAVAQDASGNIINGGTLSFVTNGNGQGGLGSPTATSNAATNITQNSATLNASVNPNGVNTTVWFEYGSTSNLGSTIGNQTIGSGNTATNITTMVTGLNGMTNYYYQVVAQNANGTVRGALLNFTTTQSGSNSAPLAFSNAASTGQTGATLNATVSPNNATTIAWFEWGTSQTNLNSSIGHQTLNSSGTFANITGYLSGLTQNNVYYFRVVAQNAYGTTYGNTLSFMTSNTSSTQGPTVYTNAAAVMSNIVSLSATINPNGSNTSAWFEYGTNTSSLSSAVGYQSMGSGNSSISFNYNLTNISPNTLYYYRVAAQNSNGINYGSILSFNSSSQTSSNVNSNATPVTVTTNASAVTSTSALIGGTVNANGIPTTAWVEWGENINSLANKTITDSIGQNSYAVTHKKYVYSLTPATIYYFRIAAQNVNGTSYGNTLVFVTPAVGAASTVNNSQSNTGSSADTSNDSVAEAVSLTASFDKDSVKAGDTVKLKVSYKNDSDSNLSNAILRVFIPNDTDFQKSNIMPVTFEGNNILKYEIGKISAKGQKDYEIEIKISENAKTDSELKFSSSLTFKNGKAGTLNTDSVLKVDSGSSLAASVSSTAKWIFGNWMIDLALAMLIGFGIYMFFFRAKSVSVI
ncbi:MAG: hypothetical protein PHN74_01535 [Candidatus Pacebacteria bacterium]|nr:hypothetical protein [Candidatus Paceibacterota bacterium]